MSSLQHGNADIRLRRLAWVAAGIVLLCFLGQGVFGWLNRASAQHSSSSGWSATGVVSILTAAPLLGFPIVGFVLAQKRPTNAIGWIMLGIGFSLAVPLDGYAHYALITRGGALPGGGYAEAINGPSWVPFIGLAGIFLVLLFPDGHLPSQRWRWFARFAAIGMILSAAVVLFGPGSFETMPKFSNPLGVSWTRPFLFLVLAIPISIVGAAVSMIQRFRRSSGIERLQLKWLVTAVGVMAGFFLLVMPLSLFAGSPVPGWLSVLQSLTLVPFALIPIAIGFAVLRYRLYEIDVVINRAVLYASLAVFISVVYVAIVVGIGAIVGSQGNAVLSALAAAVVALAFQPVRRRAQRFADRLVYGKRATPYEVLSQFSDRLAGAFATEDLLPRMARILLEGTAAERADVWVKVGDRLQVGASAPVDAPVRASVDADALPESLILVRHQGDLLGAISVEKRPGESLTPTEEKLVQDLASQAGLVIRNSALIEELRASRERLVRAQDEERRKLERNLHDGAQQQLVALAVKLRLVQGVVSKDDERVRGMLTDLQSDASEALENLRDLARGIYPPLLADRGLAAAIEAQARKSTVPIEIDSDGIGRYPQELEAAVYFSCLEALQNVAKYAGAASATVRLHAVDDVLFFEVTDDGAGFDASEHRMGTGLQGITDRLAALGGSLDVRSSPGSGTTVSGRIPARGASR
ncbi:MAG: sensor histidine kinase [Actinomycetota bacterium]|nr:sensor histidine kinase [Actinomycetota bacterium]